MNTKKISTTLSIAASVLLQACSSSGGDNSVAAPAAEANTAAPQLIGNWETNCFITAQGTSTTTTGASGSGGGSVTGGESALTMASFSQNGHVELNTEYFASTNCNANTLNGNSNFKGVYFVGASGLANDGSDITAINLSNSSSTTFTIFQIVNGFRLYLGNQSESTAGNIGDKQTTRHDGLGEPYTKR